MTDPAAELREGLRDRYAFERELGRGGMATVWLARDLRHDRPVALKVLHPELAMSLGPERFLREIRLAARLQHPHILSVYDSGETGGRLWFTMPYVEGESLRDRLARERQLPVADAVRLTREVALALDFAHRHDAVHRDIKPENILLVDGQALVADFGIAQAVGGGDERLTETGMSLGTPAYMSPEQATAERTVDGRSDIYSLGIVLYEMLAGETPFAAPTAQQMLARRMLEPPRPLRQVRETVPEGVAEAAARALAKAPADRFATAAEFARALETTATAPTTAATVVTAAPAPHRRVPLTLVLGLGFLLGLGVLFGWLRSHDSAPLGESAGTRLLAVLPFENLGDSTDEYFADGITDEVRGKLATLGDIKVIASSSAGQYKRSPKPPEQIARELGVQYLLTGKIRWEKREGGQSRVRVIPELVQVSSGSAATTRWQQPFDAALTDVFQVQADIAGRVARELNLALADSARRDLAVKPTQNLAAYDAYLKGLEAYQFSDAGRLRQALSYFEQAVALDTAYAAAWARLSQAASLVSIVGVPTPALVDAGPVRGPAGAVAGTRPARGPPGDGRLLSPHRHRLLPRPRGVRPGRATVALQRRAVPRDRPIRAGTGAVGHGARAPAPGAAAGPAVGRHRRGADAGTARDQAVRGSAGERRPVDRAGSGRCGGPRAEGNDPGEQGRLGRRPRDRGEPAEQLLAPPPGLVPRDLLRDVLAPDSGAAAPVDAAACQRVR